jgi:hypothetical protein
MYKKCRNAVKVTACFVMVTFLLSGVSHPLDVAAQKLAPAVISSESHMTEGESSFRREVIGNIKLMSVMYSIAQEIFENGRSDRDLNRALLGRFKYSESLLEGLNIDLSDISGTTPERDGVIKLRFAAQDGKSRGVMSICPTEQRHIHSSLDKSWEIIGKYAFLIEKDLSFEEKGQRDLKGAQAPATDPLLKKQIQEGRVVELYIDPDQGLLKGNRVRWVKDHTPGITPEWTYRGYEFDVFQIFSKTERKKLEEWMRAHTVRGSPVRVRVVLGNTFIGRGEDLEHSNIAHAGLRDNVIYIGCQANLEMLHFHQFRNVTF